MVRSRRNRTDDGVAGAFAASPDAAVLRVLRESGQALVKSEILDRLATGGVPWAAADKAWRLVQRHLRADVRIVVEKNPHGTSYRWSPAVSPLPPPLTPLDALALLVDGRLTRGERDALAETIRAALTAAPPSTPPGVVVEEAVSVDRLRRVELDAATELARLAIDVEENAAKGASAKAIIHRVRARLSRLRLEAVERAGESVRFDQTRHEPLRPGIPDGAPVIVVRPGYVWKLPGEARVLERPVVQD